MSALDAYKKFAKKVNRTDEDIVALINLKRGQIRQLSKLLADVIKERGDLSQMTWSFDSLDQSEIVLHATKDAAHADLLAFLSVKVNTYYDLAHSPDSDLVTLELIYIHDGQEFFLKMHREFVARLIEEYAIQKVEHASLVAYLSALLDNATYLHNFANAIGVYVTDEGVADSFSGDIDGEEPH